MQSNTIKQALHLVQENIQKAIQQSQKVKNVQLVAVSKTKPVEALQEAYNCGIRHFGENYVDEIIEKAPKLPQDINWHFIGHLQSNKVSKVIVPNLYIIETIDSVKLANKVNSHLKSLERNLKVFVQIKTSDEDSKYGVTEEESYPLIEHILENCEQLKFSGLMTIGKSGDLSAFDQLYNHRENVCKKFNLKIEDVQLSMGMSSDYQEAILAGSNNVRIGSTIFGARDYSQNNKQTENQEQNLNQKSQKEEQKN
ncbi:hypothetical protein PPERSA_12504 [Pseudocohnilembus persalinus]|uniref:Pyridoxal phosphate homeostasis protein n=1 Tax=Pseudocohnilembus persalinus TaxID=266149 RepID=A0A0V0QP28_PSEPJ|nr:hypothetical protein PPERSA_12504 [Pseudocohnilembus persalinus]|eukprot:KRX04057.1 hypothetical protein PPERSA_12504 [Pseudocohnilembus persalinus]